MQNKELKSQRISIKSNKTHWQASEQVNEVAGRMVQCKFDVVYESHVACVAFYFIYIYIVNQTGREK